MEYRSMRMEVLAYALRNSMSVDDAIAALASQAAELFEAAV